MLLGGIDHLDVKMKRSGRQTPIGEGGNRQNRLHLESRTPSWAGLWTLSYMPSIYGNDTPTGKPDPRMEESQGSFLDSLLPKIP